MHEEVNVKQTLQRVSFFQERKKLVVVFICVIFGAGIIFLTNFTIVPDVRGMFLSDAVSKLMDSNLVVGDIAYDYSEEIAVDYVIYQEKSAGTIIRKNKEIGITLSKGTD